jgi:predicted nuclease with RNAse H fold
VSLAIGLDVAARRGCDAVALDDDLVARPVGRVHTGTEFRGLLDDLSPAAVAIDAPPRWAADSQRACERELTRRSISLFTTPTAARGQGNTFYAWMLTGFEMFDAADGYEVLETFPHAVAVAIHGRLPRERKRVARLAALFAVGVDTSRLKTIDQIDAALCAYTAWCWSNGDAINLGDEREGQITLPGRTLLDRYTR